MGYGAYDLIRAAAPDRHVDALMTGRALLTIERAVGLDWEARLNDALTGHKLLESAAGGYYGTLHFLLTPLVLILIARRTPELWARCRTALVVTTAMALVGYWVLPTAPPRLLGPPFTDTLAGAEGPVSALVNVDAAFPSLHVAWAVWVAIVAGHTLTPRLRVLWWIYPIATTLVVLTTANHYLLDAVAGGALAVAAWVAAGRFYRRRPDDEDAVAASSPEARWEGRIEEAPMPYGDPPAIQRLLAGRTWAMIGLTGNTDRTVYEIASFLQARGARIIPVSPEAQPVLGEPGYAKLADVPEQVDVVGVYRRSEFAGPHVDEAIAAGAVGVWMPLGVVDEKAAIRAEEAGLDIVMDRCPKIDWPTHGPG